MIVRAFAFISMSDLPHSARSNAGVLRHWGGNLSAELCETDLAARVRAEAECEECKASPPSNICVATQKTISEV